MTILAGAWKGAEQRALGITDIPEDLWRSLQSFMSATGVKVTPKTALQSAAVYACVRVLAESVASLPLHVYRRRDGRGKDKARDYFLYPLLHSAPNEEMTSFEFRETLMGHLTLWGNAYAEIVYDNAGRARALWPLRPDRMRLERVRGELVYIYDLYGGLSETERIPPVKVFAPQRIMHLRGLGGNGLQGYSVIRYHRESIGLDLATREFGGRFFGNDARPGGILEHPGVLSDEAHKRLRSSWESRHQGLDKSHRIAILEEGMKYDEIGMPLEDAQFLETRKYQRSEIAGLFRVPPHMIGDLERATFCLPAGELVYTHRGPRPIETIRRGDWVWSRSEDGLTLSRVKHAVGSGRDPILTIRTTNRTLRCNAKHPILCRRKEYVPLPEGQIGGANIDGKKKAVRWVTRYVPAGELEEGDTIVTLDGLPDGGSIEHCPTRAPSLGFMEFCGLLLGDGNVIDGETNAYVTIARAQHASYMDYYREVVQQEFVSFGGAGNGVVRDGVPTQPVSLQEGERQTRFSSVLAAEELKQLGLSGDARSKRVPDWVFQMPEAHRLALLRGFLDADGSVGKKGRIAFHSVNETMLRQIRHLCIGCGVPVTNIRNQEGVTTLPNGEKTEFSVWTFTCSDPGANRRIGSRTPHYIARMEAGQPFERKARKYPRHGGRGFDERGLSLARISSIEIGPAEEVYDLEVAGTHSFIASGVVVHNSNIEHQDLAFVRHSLRPWLVRMEQRMDLDLILPDDRGQYFTKHNVEGLLRGDSVARAQYYRERFMIGSLSPNDIRELEDENPIEGGDEAYVQLNMIPLFSASQGLPDAGESSAEPDSAGQRAERVGAQTIQTRDEVREARAARSAQTRHRMQRAQMRVYADVAGRVLRREANDIANAARRMLPSPVAVGANGGAANSVSARALPDFENWLREFYREHESFVGEQMLPVARAYAEMVAPEVADEIGVELTDELKQHVARFVTGYVRQQATRHVARNEATLQQILVEDADRALEAVEEQLEAWRQEPAAQSIAQEESVRANSAVASMLYTAAGIAFLRWRSFGDSCPYCRELNGRRVGIAEWFLAAGEEFQPEGAEKPLTPTRNVGHPPGHRGCDCLVVAG